MGRDMLGAFEHQVLIALLQRGGEAYSAPLVMELEERTGRDVSTAAVYIALRRLEEKGLVRSRMRPPEPDEGGRDRRHFAIEAEGRARVLEERATWERLWAGLDPRTVEEG